MRRMVFIAASLISMILVVPSLFVVFMNHDEDASSVQEVVVSQTEKAYAAHEKKEEPTKEEETAINIHVYRSNLEKIETVSLESYVAGVVASEMPASYAPEALKAQALSARTIIIDRLLNKKGDQKLPKGADVTDTVSHQVYKNQEELQEQWGQDFSAYWQKVTDAVKATENQLLTYEGKPIMAAFFSTSNGYTENAKDYWESDLPYLRSVESAWDQSSPRYTKEVTIPIKKFEELLGVSLPQDGSVGTIVSRTDSGRVEKVEVNDHIFTGRELREMLSLDSTDFNWYIHGKEVVIQTKGWGHGIGLSQFGANAMALEGKTYEEIVKHYYTGVEVTEAKPFLQSLSSQ
ncbi:stage II sporulation protein D [Shouchella lonarensis]|uniref:Stage II sporulation protein D n=1 Tax=Shouchella lonarensis TaxID=1464122 RepID=A0A1G6GXB6_9BACI|nr:stage II sporulation protein D [Shouchella lonarensis]SDB86677.1 stage II sporulation protein D [Shouchella lonarensis]